MSEVYFFLPGEPLPDGTSWAPLDGIPVGAVSLSAAFVTDGFEFQTDKREEDITPIPTRTMLTTRSVEFSFTMSKRSVRVMAKLIDGVYRLPGDKPLIHRGGRAR